MAQDTCRVRCCEQLTAGARKSALETQKPASNACDCLCSVLIEQLPDLRCVVAMAPDLYHGLDQAEIYSKKAADESLTSKLRDAWKELADGVQSLNEAAWTSITFQTARMQISKVIMQPLVKGQVCRVCSAFTADINFAGRPRYSHPIRKSGG